MKSIISLSSNNWQYLLTLFLGCLLACTMGAFGPIYMNALNRLGFESELTRILGETIDITIFGARLPASSSRLNNTSDLVDKTLYSYFDESITYQHRTYKSGVYLLGYENREIPVEPDFSYTVARGWIQNIKDLSSNSTLLSGSFAISNDTEDLYSAVITKSTQQRFQFEIGQTIELRKSISSKEMVPVKISGVIEPNYQKEKYWANFEMFLDPPPLADTADATPPPGVSVAPDEPPVVLFISEQDFVNYTEGAGHGKLISTMWFAGIDKNSFISDDIQYPKLLAASFERKIKTSLKGSTVYVSSIKGIVLNIEEKATAANISLSVLITSLILSGILLVALAARNLTSSRNPHFTLLKLRGASLSSLLNFYIFEIFVITIIATILAPVIATLLSKLLMNFTGISSASIGIISLITSSPIAWLYSLIVAIIAGFVSSLVSIISLFQAGRKINYARIGSESPSLLQKHFFDGVLGVLGFIAIWYLLFNQRSLGATEQNSSAQFTSMLIPSILLVSIALLFIRLFPMTIRYLSGRSTSIIHLLWILGVSYLCAHMIWQNINNFQTFEILEIFLFVSFTVIGYTITHFKYSQLAYWIFGLLLQSSTIIAFHQLSRLEITPIMQFNLIYLGLLLFLQLIFPFLTLIDSRSPLWISIPLLRLDRGERYYSTLLLLVITSAGLITMASTVGGTFSKLQTDRSWYQNATDIKVTGISKFTQDNAKRLEEKYQSVDGVTNATRVMRINGGVGSVSSEILAIDPVAFASSAWFREDFSGGETENILKRLDLPFNNNTLFVPEGSTKIGMWIKPSRKFNNLFLLVVLQGSEGKSRTISLGSLNHSDWKSMSASIPSTLTHPIELLSIQIHEPGIAKNSKAKRTPGNIYIDRVFVADKNTEEIVIDEMETSRWSPIATTLIAPDYIEITGEEVYSGESSTKYKFGVFANRDVRGIYINNIDSGRFPVIASKYFEQLDGYEINIGFYGTVAGRLTPLVVIDTIDYFPTLYPEKTMFLIGNINHLSRYLNIMSRLESIEPSEVYIDTDTSTESRLGSIIKNISPRGVSVSDITSTLNEIKSGNIHLTGWRLLSITSVVFVIISISIGNYSHLDFLSKNSLSTTALLKALGINNLEIAIINLVEHFFVMGCGLLVGTLVGRQISLLIVTNLTPVGSLNTTSPPIVVTTEWMIMLPAFLVITAIMFVAQLASSIKIYKTDIPSITRIA